MRSEKDREIGWITLNAALNRWDSEQSKSNKIENLILSPKRFRLIKFKWKLSLMVDVTYPHTECVSMSTVQYIQIRNTIHTTEAGRQTGNSSNNSEFACTQNNNKIENGLYTTLIHWYYFMHNNISTIQQTQNYSLGQQQIMILFGLNT